MEFGELADNCRRLASHNDARPFVVGLGGGECVGKSYLADRWKEHATAQSRVIVVSIDGYLALSRAERMSSYPDALDLRTLAMHIGDHPDCFELNELTRDLETITCHGEWVPRHYDYGRGEVVTADSTIAIPSEAIVIVEGLFALHHALHDVVDIKVFVQTSESIMRRRYLQRHEERKKRSAHETVDSFDRMVLPAYREFIAPTARHAQYFVLSSDSRLEVRGLKFGGRGPLKREQTRSQPESYGIFITHNLDETTDFVMNVIRDVAASQHIQVIRSSPGGAAESPPNDVRKRIAEAEALLAVVGRDTSWVSNEIGMAYALHLPIYVIHRPEATIKGIAEMVTSQTTVNIYKKTELEAVCRTAFEHLKEKICDQRDSLPEVLHSGSKIIRIRWEKYYELVQAAHRIVNSPDPDSGYAPTLLLGISRGGIIAADAISRLAQELPLGLLEAKRRKKHGEVFFDEEPLRTLLEAHCTRVEREVRILVIDDVLKSGTSLLSALQTVERVMCTLDTSVTDDFRIRSLVLISLGDTKDNRYVPDYCIETVEEGTSVILPYGRG